MSDLVAGREGEGREDHHQHGEHHDEGAVHVAVRRLAADGVADEEADTEDDQQPRHGGRREAGDLGEREGDVGEGAEHPAVAKDR